MEGGDLTAGRNEWKPGAEALPLSLPPAEKLEKDNDDFDVSRTS